MSAIVRSPAALPRDSRSNPTMKPRAAASAIRPKTASWSAGSCTREAYSRAAAVSALARILERMGRHGVFRGGRCPRRTSARSRAPPSAGSWPIFRPYRRQVAIVGVAIVISSGLGVVNPLMIRQIFDDALFGPARRPTQAPARALRVRTCMRSDLRGDHGPDPDHHGRDRRRADLPVQPGRPPGDAGPPQLALQASAVHAAAVLHDHPNGRDPVAPGERRRRACSAS